MGNASPKQEEEIIIQGIIKGSSTEKNINIKLEEDTIQDYLNKEYKDNNFNKLLEFEKKLLKDIIFKDDKYKRIISEGNLHFDKNDVGILYNNNSNLKDKIIKNEETKEVMKKKIIDEINNIKNDVEKLKIEYLTILLVGRKGIGKTPLIKYIFELNQENNNIMQIKTEENFTSYSKQNFPLKIIEFKGIGYDINNSVETIAQQAFYCIQSQIKKNKRNNYNEFVHCIWYLINGVRMDELEFNFLLKLREAYKDKNIPIIMVYNQDSKECGKQMKAHITEKLREDINFVEILSIDNKVMKSNIIKSSFGRKQLIQETLSKCSQALEGDLIELMTGVISKSL